MDNKLIKIKKEGEDFYIDLEDLKDMVDIKNIDSYELTFDELNRILINFYDNEGKRINPF